MSCASLGAFKVWVRQAYCTRQAPGLPQLFDHIGHHLTPRHSHLVNTGLRVWENTNICLVHRAKLRGELYFFKKANVLLGKVRVSLLTLKRLLIFHVSGCDFCFFTCHKFLFMIILRGSPSKRLSQPLKKISEFKIFLLSPSKKVKTS